MVGIISLNQASCSPSISALRALPMSSVSGVIAGIIARACLAPSLACDSICSSSLASSWLITPPTGATRISAHATNPTNTPISINGMVGMPGMMPNRQSSPLVIASALG